ncbi:thiol reductant ABC exporter subunit CydC [Robbsia sp. Bb-Pol-6]|uniref:Thiol reductant ABC exporter subunit CydC n=1 Tax=Robbsia betulipollinis TaxID=2981849 RepID=A0ABT3ZJV8_9BURK|nr:thiol reductant ABC exporter subunit CydC [Robbsia betulipollinis]
MPLRTVPSAAVAPSSWALFRRLLGLFRPYRARMALGVLLSTLATLAGIGLMGLSGWFLASMGLAGVAGASMDYFTPAAIIRGAAIVRTAGRYAERLVNHDLTLRVLSSLRVHLFARLLPLAPAGTAFLGHTELFSRLRADVDRLEHAYLAVFLPILVALIALPLVTVVLACYVWPVAVLGALAVLLVAVALPWWLARCGVATSIAMVETEATLRALTSDALLGAAELRIYGGAAAQAQRIAALTAAHGRHRSKLDRLQATGGVLVTLAAQLATVTGLVLGARALQHHAIGPAELAMVVLLTLAQFEAVASLPEAISQLRATLVCAARVFALIDAEPRVADPAASTAFATSAARADLRLRDVHLRYGEDRPWALRGLDLDLPAGRRIAIVGPSGAGKSSLIGALLRFHPIQSGSIELAGRPLDTYSGDAVREMIAVVEQRTHIFNGSLLDNLLIARPDATAERIREVLGAAQLTDVVAGLPEGLNTWLGEAGVLLSGGEARRVAIARALLADRPIVVLDEPTEGLDAHAAQALLGALARLTAGRSVILITHRLEGMASLVDARLTLRDGRIVN